MARVIHFKSAVLPGPLKTDTPPRKLSMVSIALDWSLFVQIANFLILMLALNFLLYKPLKRSMSERDELFQTLRTHADLAKNELAEGQAVQERHRAEVLEQGSDVQSKFKQQGREKELELLTASQDKVAKRLQEARQELSSQMETVKSQIGQQAQELAGELVEKVLGRKLTNDG
jgi:F-type H+-transporting ATPase subunit b